MIRIGNCSGFYGDRMSAMREMLEGGELDYLTGDYLAELTMLILGRDQMKDASLGYAKTFLRQMSDCMTLAQERGVKIVANAGGLNPAGLAAKLREIAAEQGVTVSIAHVEGDDLRARADELALSGQGGAKPLTANAYLGAFGIAEALTSGAAIVVTGRVTDASVVVGPAIAELGWGREDLAQLAGAVVAGHVIECGTQATGGNFSGFADLDLSTRESRRLGFPIAEIAADGSSVITKHASTGGAVTVDTVTAQLLYEIGHPAYLGPDVTTHLASLKLAQQAPDRVSITGVLGSPPPSTAKVCLNMLGGFRNSVEFILTGLDVDAKAAWVRAQMEDALGAGKTAPDTIDWQLDRTGHDDPVSQSAATTLLRCHVKSSTPDPVGRAFSSAAIELALASYPGFAVTRPPAAGSPYGIYQPAYVDQAAVPHVVVRGDGTRIDIEPPPLTEDSPAIETLEAYLAPDGPYTRAPLGRVAHARSGDKGGDANIGVWVDTPDGFAWLWSLLRPERVRDLLPEAADLDVRVYKLRNLNAVNIVIHGLLGDGVAASTRFDPQAKALGEWLRARHVDIPDALLAARRRTSSKASAIGHDLDDATRGGPP